MTYCIKVNHATIRGPLVYKEGHTRCEGRRVNMKEELKVMKGGISTFADPRRGQGSPNMVETKVGTLAMEANKGHHCDTT